MYVNACVGGWERGVGVDRFALLNRYTTHIMSAKGEPTLRKDLQRGSPSLQTPSLSLFLSPYFSLSLSTSLHQIVHVYVHVHVYVYV